MSALLSTPRSHVTKITLTQMYKKKKKDSKLIRFFTPRQLRALLSDGSTLPPSHCGSTTVPTHRRVSHAFCAPTQLLRVDAQGGLRAASTGSVRGAEKGEQSAERSCRRNAKNRSCRAYDRKGEAGRKKNDCGALGPLSGGIRAAGWYRTTAFGCAQTSGTFRTGGSAALPRHSAGRGRSGGGKHPFIARSAPNPRLCCH